MLPRQPQVVLLHLLQVVLEEVNLVDEAHLLIVQLVVEDHRAAVLLLQFVLLSLFVEEKQK